MDLTTLTLQEEDSIRTLQDTIESIQIKLADVVSGITLLGEVLSQVMNLPVVTRLCNMEQEAACQKQVVAVQRDELQGHIEQMKMAFPFLTK